MKRTIIPKGQTENLAPALWRRLQEVGFIVLCALAIFLVAALFTYHEADPGWSHTAVKKSIQNAAGQAGAFFSDIGFYLFGYIAYMFPAMIGYAGFSLLTNRVESSNFHKVLWSLRIIGFVLSVTAACGLACLHFGTWNKSMPVGTGGILGQLITVELKPTLGYLGSTLVFIALFLVGITLATGLSWFGLLDVLSKGLWEKINTMRAALPSIFFRLKQGYVVRKNLRQYAAASSSSVRIEPRSTFKKEPVLQKEPLLRKEPVLQNTPTKQVHTAFSVPATVKCANTTSLPSVDLLAPMNALDQKASYSPQQLESLSREVETRLLEFGVQVTVVAVYPGPVITRFELELAPGLKVSKISGLAKDLARALSVNRVRVVEVIPGKSVVGLEIPNEERELVRLREIIESTEYHTSTGPLSLALGKDTEGGPVVVNLAKMPHLLVAGTTGSGKSVGINVMLLSLLYKATPAEIRLILIDPKMLELSIYDGIPHLLTPVVTDMKDAANALRWCVGEMERRYQLMAALGVRNVLGYNHKIVEAKQARQPILDPFWQADMGSECPELNRLPYIVVIIDEFADMMMVVGKKVEELIARIAQKARAAGIHLILATQRPSVDVITGLIKANVPTRISFQVSSRIDSRTILDQQGAEQLLGHGDMLYLAPGTGVPIRIHGAFVSDEEVHTVVKALKQLGEPDYTIDILSSGGIVSSYSNSSISFDEENNGESDELYDAAVQVVMESRRASISHLQRRLKIGYNRAARLIETMEAAGIVSNMQTNGGREVLARHTEED